MFDCVDLHVPMTIMQHVINVESSGNPLAIGVVGGRLLRQPDNLEEAIATVKNLERLGYNYSLGIAQINKYNLKKYGLDSYQKAFEVCPNLKVGTQILKECYQSAGNSWSKAFSCYYSGNFVTGFRHGYVQKILASISRVGEDEIINSPEVKPIPVIANRVMGKKNSKRTNIKNSWLRNRIVTNKTNPMQLISAKEQQYLPASHQGGQAKRDQTEKDEAFIF